MATLDLNIYTIKLIKHTAFTYNTLSMSKKIEKKDIFF